MPGVPYEMKGIMSDQVIPRLKNNYALPFIYYRSIMTEGIGESFLAEKIADWENALGDKGISIAYLPSPGMVKIRLGSSTDQSAGSESKEEVKSKVDAEAEKLYEMVPSFIFGENDVRPEESIAEILRRENKTLATAESCTGGYLSHMLTTVPGSSQYYMGSVISYSNEAKVEALDVNPSSLESNGAVSQEVVEEMALGAMKKFNTNFALSTSGVAGPDGGTDEKPVGTVWIAIAGEKGVYSKKFLFEKDRSRNIRRAALAALSLLRRYLQDRLDLH